MVRPERRRRTDRADGIRAAGGVTCDADRRGGHVFDTFILLANPSTQQADVTVTYLRESGAPIVKTYTVAPTSRVNIDGKDAVPEQRALSFGARIDVTNNVPIAVERSRYWNDNGLVWAGGSNALATRLP